MKVLIMFEKLLPDCFSKERRGNVKIQSSKDLESKYELSEGTSRERRRNADFIL